MPNPLRYALKPLSIPLLLWTALPALCAGPTAEEILAKGRQALGNVSQLQSLSISGTRRAAIEGPDGQSTMTRDTQLDFLLPDKFLRAETMDLPGGIPGPTMVDALNGNASWTDTRNAPTGGNVFVVRRGPPGASDDPAAQEAARTRTLRTQYLRNLLLYTLTPPPGTEVKFDLVGEAESPDGKAWMIDVAGPDKFAMRLFLDQKTHLPLMATWRALAGPKPVFRSMQVSGPGDGHRPDPKKIEEEARKQAMPAPREVEYELRLGEYEKQGGILFPKVTTLHSEGKLSEEFEIKSVKVNPSNLKPEKFRK